MYSLFFKKQSKKKKKSWFGVWLTMTSLDAMMCQLLACDEQDSRIPIVTELKVQWSKKKSKSEIRMWYSKYSALWEDTGKSQPKLEGSETLSRRKKDVQDETWRLLTYFYFINDPSNQKGKPIIICNLCVCYYLQSFF